MSKVVVLGLCGIVMLGSCALAQSAGRLIDKFCLDQTNNIMWPQNFGIANGKITTGIACDDLFSVNGIWAPPYVSSDFVLQATVDGVTIAEPAFLWRPFYIERSARLGAGVVAQSNTVLVPEGRAFLFALLLENPGEESVSVPLEFRVSGSLDKMLTDADWGFMAPQSTTPTRVNRMADNFVVLQQGEEGIAIATSQGIPWDDVGQCFAGVVPVAAHGEARLHITVAIGANTDARGQCADLAAAPEAAVHEAYRVYDQRLVELYEKIPRLTSDNAALVRFYDRSLTPLLMNRWYVPEFKLQPFYATGSVRGGCVGDYLWNVGECAEILSLFDPQATKAHIRQFLETGIDTGFGFCPINGERMHPNHYYPINQEKVIAMAYHYVRNTGDMAFLGEPIGDKTILEAIIAEALYLDDPSKPVALVDYNTCDPQRRGGQNHLELRTPLGELNYTHVMPDLNGRRYANYVLAAELSALAERPRPDLIQRAEQLKVELKRSLWDAKNRWFVYKMPDADPPITALRYTVQMFYMLGSGVLDEEEESGLLNHLNDREFLSDYGLHSLAKHDPAYLQEDVDNGGPGACTCFPLNIAKTLYGMGKPDLANDILKRILWWGEKMPYWGDSFYADTIRYREETPLQCTIDAITGAQCILYGMFGIAPRFDGSIVIHPSMPSFARTAALSGVKLRGTEFDVALSEGTYTVRCQGKTMAANIGQTVVINDGEMELR